MSTTLAINQCKASVGWDYEQTTAYGTNSIAAGNYSFSTTFANGTGAGNAQVLYVDKLTIATSTTQTLSLASGSAPKDQFGNNVVFTKIRGMFFWLDSADTSQASSISIGGNANGLVNWVADKTDKVNVRTGGQFMTTCVDATGFAVTATTADQLDIHNNDGSNTAKVKLVIWGE